MGGFAPTNISKFHPRKHRKFAYKGRGFSIVKIVFPFYFLFGERIDFEKIKM